MNDDGVCSFVSLLTIMGMQQVQVRKKQQKPPEHGSKRRRRKQDADNLRTCMIVSLTLTNGFIALVLYECWYFGMIHFSLHTSSTQPKSTFQSLYKQRRPNATKTPILVVGLPKAGTSTLFEFFRCKQKSWKCQHWYCCGQQDHANKGGPYLMSDCMLHNLELNFPILDGCGDYDVYTELNGPRRDTDTGKLLDSKRPKIFLPQHYHLPDLHAFAPDATWILNIRPIEEWVHSVLKVPGNALVRQIIHEVQHHETSFETPKGRNQTKSFLRMFWQRHVQQVQSFCQFHQHKLVVVNITSPTAADDLSQSLGWATNPRPSAAACWGQHNIGEYREEEMMINPKYLKHKMHGRD